MGAVGDVYVCDPRAGCLQHSRESACPAAGDSLAVVGVVARGIRGARGGLELARQPLGLPEGAKKLSERK